MRGSTKKPFVKNLLAVCAMGMALTAFSGAGLARTPGPGGPVAPQVQQQNQQVAHGREFRRGPPAYVRHHHYRQRYYGHGRPGYRHGPGRGYEYGFRRRGHGTEYGYYRSYRAPRVHSGFNLVLQFGDNNRRSGGGGYSRGGGGYGHRR